MNRNEFLKLFNSNHIELEVEEKDVENILKINLMILSKKTKEIDSFNLNTVRFMGFKPKDKSFENNTLKININEIYDHIIEEHNLLGQNKKLYRLESSDNLGIYDAGGIYLFSEEQRRKKNDPFYDDKLNSIFDSINDNGGIAKYKGDWKFAFDKLEDLIEWIGDNETYLNISKDSRGFNIKEITVPENMIIYGNKQAIFKDNSVRETLKLNLNTIEHQFLKKNKKLTY